MQTVNKCKANTKTTCPIYWTCMQNKTAVLYFGVRQPDSRSRGRGSAPWIH